MNIALCLFRDQFSHVKPVERVLQGFFQFVYTEHWNTSEIDRVKPDIVIGINEHHAEISECYHWARLKNIPTLTLQDGILEWRHIFENPLYNGITGAPLHQPILADKMACIGLSSASLMLVWNNRNKIELTGMPKMDGILCSMSGGFKKGTGAKFTILILTSSKPWFDATQKKIVLQQLKDIKSYLSERRDVEVIWRVTKEIPDLLGIENHYQSKSTEELSVLIQRVDAVITTISTTILESQLLEKPVASIDYFNTPNFVYTRWSIRHKDHINSVVNEMMTVTSKDKQIQDSFLLQNIYIHPNFTAAQQVSELIKRMVTYSKNDPGKILPFNMLGNLPQLENRDPIVSSSTYKVEEVNLVYETILRYKMENQKLKNQLQARSWYGVAQVAMSKMKHLIFKSH